jgi:hypothetical protein
MAWKLCRESLEARDSGASARITSYLSTTLAFYLALLKSNEATAIDRHLYYKLDASHGAHRPPARDLASYHGPLEGSVVDCPLGTDEQEPS